MFLALFLVRKSCAIISDAATRRSAIRSGAAQGREITRRRGESESQMMRQEERATRVVREGGGRRSADARAPYARTPSPGDVRDTAAGRSAWTKPPPVSGPAFCGATATPSPLQCWQLGWWSLGVGWRRRCASAGTRRFHCFKGEVGQAWSFDVAFSIRCLRAGAPHRAWCGRRVLTSLVRDR